MNRVRCVVKTPRPYVIHTFDKIILLGLKWSNKLVSWNRETLSRDSNMWMSLSMHVPNTVFYPQSCILHHLELRQFANLKSCSPQFKPLSYLCTSWFQLPTPAILCHLSLLVVTLSNNFQKEILWDTGCPDSSFSFSLWNKAPHLLHASGYQYGESPDASQGQFGRG